MKIGLDFLIVEICKSRNIKIWNFILQDKEDSATLSEGDTLWVEERRQVSISRSQDRIIFMIVKSLLMYRFGLF